MRFEERKLKPYAEPVLPDALQEEKVYFSVIFLDEDGLVPSMEPRVFIGSKAEAEATNSSKTSAPTSAGFALSRPMLRMKPRLRPEQDGTCSSMSVLLMY